MRPLNSIISLAINIRIAILPLEMNGSVAPSPSNDSRRGRFTGATSGLTFAATAWDLAISILYQDRDQRHRNQKSDNPKDDHQNLAILFSSIFASHQVGRHSLGQTLFSTITSKTT